MGPSQRLHFCLFHFIVDLWYLYNYEEQYCLYHASSGVSETLQDNKLFIKPYQRHNYCVPWFPWLDVGLNHVGLISQKKSASFLRVREESEKENWLLKKQETFGCSDITIRNPSKQTPDPGICATWWPEVLSPTQSSQYVQCVAGCLQLMLRVNEYRFAWVEADGVNWWALTCHVG